MRNQTFEASILRSYISNLSEQPMGQRIIIGLAKSFDTSFQDLNLYDAKGFHFATIDIIGDTLSETIVIGQTKHLKYS